MNNRKPRRQSHFSNSVSDAVHGGADATESTSLSKGRENKLGIYIHTPFCSKKCPYCDFYTLEGQSDAIIERYQKALLNEMDGWESLGWTSMEVDTIFLGGGTPSLLPVSFLESILEKLHLIFHLRPSTEVTLEINPETVTRDRVKAWRQMGINRGSLGVQSNVKRELQYLGREHLADRSESAFEMLRKGGFENLSIDLIFGLENQTKANLEQTLRQVLSWAPDHFSAYQLTLESQTQFGKWVREGKIRALEDDRQRDLYLYLTEELMKNGFQRYEISNFAKRGKESRHNLKYWRGENYWGLGVSAHSFSHRNKVFHRFWNPRNLNQYMERVENGQSPKEGEEFLSPDLHWVERLMTGLRLEDGVQLANITGEIGTPFSENVRKALDQHEKTGFILREGDRCFLSKEGMMVADSIFLSFFDPD